MNYIEHSVHTDNCIILPCIKGFGDAVIACNLSRHLAYKKIIFVFTARNYRELSMLVPKSSKVYVFDDFGDCFSLYNLKRSIFKVLPDFFKYRARISRIMPQGCVVFVDIMNVRNRLLHANIPTITVQQDLPLYDAITLRFGVQLFQPPPISNTRKMQILIFPSGSSVDRRMSVDCVRMIFKFFSNHGHYVKLCVHCNELPFYENVSGHMSVYQSVCELRDLIITTDIVFSVDSLPLHMAIYERKSVYVFTDGYMKFIPTNMLENKMIYPLTPCVAALERIGLHLMRVSNEEM